MKEFQMIAKTFKGLEGVLANELVALGANDVQIERRAVSFTGDKALLYRANLCLRTASRVLVPIASFKAGDADAVYEQVKALDWSQYMTVQTGFQIDATVYSETFRHSRYVTYRVKDAIADWWNDREGKRPNVRLTDPDLCLNVHIANETVTLSLDSSGESLHKRGYRVAATEAPINEALAAGMLLLAGWKGETDFYDPMCGSGTLLIEAALIAQNIAPGIFRKGFAFEKWQDFDKDLFEEIYNDDSNEQTFTHHIYGSDASFYAVQQALKNVKAAGQTRCIEVKQIRLQEIKRENAEPALVIVNPPYGERLAQDKDVMELYNEMGTAFKHQFAGSTAWVISSNEEAMKCIGLKPSDKLELMNGELECQFNKFELFAGEHKDFVVKRKEEGFERQTNRFEHKSSRFSKRDDDRRLRSFDRPEGDYKPRRFEHKDGEERPRRFEHKDGFDRSSSRFDRKPNHFGKRDDDRRPRSFDRPEGDYKPRRFEHKDGEERPRRFEHRGDAERKPRGFARRDGEKRPFRREDRNGRNFNK